MSRFSLELKSVIMVSAFSLLLVASFPYEALHFTVPTASLASKPGVAFVELTASEEAAALKAARTSWKLGMDSDMSRFRRRLPMEDLPVFSQKVTRFSEVPLIDDAATLGYTTPVWQPSCAAGQPTSVTPQPVAKPAPAFSREELLKLP